MLFNFNEDVYFRYISVSRINLFNIYPLNLEINNRKIRWSTIYEEINIFLNNHSDFYDYSGENDLDDIY
jgi:hypothetical protein